jgi:predicted DCC family thiol-disulfide oxidoreductase YuxK
VATKARAEVVFFDGGCGLCHAFVAFIIPRDHSERFHFAPLGGETFARLVSGEARRSLPDSVVVQTGDGRVLVKSGAVLHVFDRLGGGYRLLGWVALACPRPIRDAIYDAVARARRRLFAAPSAVCPVVPVALRGRFEP